MNVDEQKISGMLFVGNEKRTNNYCTTNVQLFVVTTNFYADLYR